MASGRPEPDSGSLGGHAMVFVLPHGLSMGGVTEWARRASIALQTRGARTEFVAPGRCGLGTEPGIAEIADAVIHAVREVCAAGAERVLIAPQLCGAAYAAACVAAHRLADPGVSVVGWMHTDIRYDTELIRRFAPALSGVGCVSRAVHDHLLAESVCPEAMLSIVRTGVPVDAGAPVAAGPAHNPLRLLYVGRLDPFQKRAGVLPSIVEHLRASGLPAELTIIGDGPVAPTLAQAASRLGGIELLGALPADQLGPIYAAHDLLLLPSRSEGLGLARIEAAMHGCVPVVTPGGAAEGIRDGASGVVVDCHADADDDEAAERFAASILALRERPLGPMRVAASDDARASFGMDAFADSMARFMRGVRPDPGTMRAWIDIAARPQAAADFTVPPDAPARIAESLADLAGREVVLHGAGAHTRAVWEPLCRLGVRVVAISDDDPQKWGSRLFGVPVINPAHAADHGADTAVISSWLHEAAMWQRRNVFERAGLRVRRMYASGTPAPRAHAVGR